MLSRLPPAATLSWRSAGFYLFFPAAAAVFCVLSLPSVLGAACSGDPSPRVEAAASFVEGFSSQPQGRFLLAPVLLAAIVPAARDLSGRSADVAFAEAQIGRLAAKVRAMIGGRKDPSRVIGAMNRLFFDLLGFSYDSAPGEPDNFLLDRVLSWRRGNCLGLTVAYLAVAERLDLPIRGVHVPSHCFARWDGEGARINIEMGEQGAAWEDERYARLFRISGGRPYLASLGEREMAGFYLVSVGAAYSRRGREGDALRFYRAAERFFPDLPELHFNRGVSLQKLGRRDEAIAALRRAVSLDPGLAAAHDNLGAALAQAGRLAEALEEAQKAAALDPANAATRGNLAAVLLAAGMADKAIAEYERIMAVDPCNGRAAAGLARAFYACGRIGEAASWCERAESFGYPIDPSLRRVLGRGSRAAQARFD